VEAEVLAGLAEADGVGAALVVGVAEPDAVVFPEADIADVVGPGRRLFEGEEAAARTGEAAPQWGVAAGELAQGVVEPSRSS